MHVSLVIPTHNRSATLGRALASVVSQTRAPDEVIVVDDGSDDDAVRLVATQFGVQYIFQSHAGVSSARNRGIDAATGEWIAFLDSDDEWLPDKLEHQLQSLSHSPASRISHCNEIWIRGNRRINPKRKHQKSGGWIFSRCLPLCVISPSSALIHRSVFDRVGVFDETLPVCEDYDLWLRICARYSVHYVSQPLVVKHGGHADQLSRRYWGMDRFRIQALESILVGADLAWQDRCAVLDTLVGKIGIYLSGAEKRGRYDTFKIYHRKLEHYRRIVATNSDSAVSCSSL